RGRWAARRPHEHSARPGCSPRRARRARGAGAAVCRGGRRVSRRRGPDPHHAGRARPRKVAGGVAMSARRVLAAAVVVVALAGCAQPGSGDGGAGGSGSGRSWSREVGWPFSLGVRGRDAVVTVSGNRVVALESATGRERWRTDVARVTHYEP